MSNITDVITKLQNEIKGLETEKAREEGIIQALETELKEKYNLEGLSEAREEVKRLNSEVAILQQELDTSIAELKEKFPNELGGLL